MKKSILEQFIVKYNLGGAADSVLWTSTGKKLSTNFITDDKNAMGIISTTEAPLDKGEYGIFDTANLKAMMPALDDDVQLSINKSGKVVTSLQLRDASTKVTFVLSDKSIIPSVPDLKALPEMTVEIPLDKKFMDTFSKAKAGLPDVETFTVISEGDKTRVVLGYSETINRNQISISVETKEDAVVSRPCHFSAEYMKSILAANKEAESGSLQISEDGLAHVTFSMTGFEVDYYLVEIN